MTFDTDVDCFGGSPRIKDCVKVVREIMLDNNLVDIWRIRNSEKHRYTWRNSTSKIFRHLDFWLIIDNLQEDIKQVKIGPSLKSDHSSISLEIDSVVDPKHGPALWKLNTCLLDDPEYMNLINDEYPNWLHEFEDIADKRVPWDLIKFRIRQVYIGETGRSMHERIKEHDREIRLARTQTSAVSEHAHKTGHYPLCNEVKFIDRDPHWYTRRVKEAIHIRLHPDNINRDSGIEISEAWIPTIKKHNRKTAQQRTTEGTTSRQNSEDRNAPITAHQCDINGTA